MSPSPGPRGGRGFSLGVVGVYPGCRDASRLFSPRFSYQKLFILHWPKSRQDISERPILTIKRNGKMRIIISGFFGLFPGYANLLGKSIVFLLQPFLHRRFWLMLLQICVKNTLPYKPNPCDLHTLHLFLRNCFVQR